MDRGERIGRRIARALDRTRPRERKTRVGPDAAEPALTFAERIGALFEKGSQRPLADDKLDQMLDWEN